MSQAVLITGTSEGGLGDALAQEYHRRGLRVFASARSLQKIQHLVDLGIEPVELDVSEQKSIDSAVEKVREATGGKLDILVNNAGQGYSLPLSDVDIAEVRKVFEVNVIGVMSTTKAFLPLIIAAKGKIVNNSSIAGKMPLPFQGAYNATKAAVDSISDTLRVEVRPFGVQVVVIHTGLVKTKFFNNLPNATLPEDSIWMPAKDVLDAQITEMATGGPSSASWASEVVAKTVQKNAPQDLWPGTESFFVWLLISFFPSSFLSWLAYRLKVSKIANVVAK